MPAVGSGVAVGTEVGGRVGSSVGTCVGDSVGCRVIRTAATELVSTAAPTAPATLDTNEEFVKEDATKLTSSELNEELVSANDTTTSKLAVHV